MIERRTVGRSGLQVSAMTLGTMTFCTEGPYGRIGATPSEMSRVVETALDAGIDTFDTANVYGDGESERVLGQLLGKRRSSVVIATKVRFPMDHSGERPPANAYGLSRSGIIGAVDDSLRRLDTEWIDLLQLHMQDRLVPIEETLSATDDLVRAGKVRYVGISNYTAYRLVEALWAADKRDLDPIVSVQLPWSLVGRDAERELVPAARHFRLGLFVYSPLARGFLTGKYRRGEDPPEGSRLREWREELAEASTEHNWKVLESVREIAGRRETSPAAVSLAWALRKPGVSSVVVGARTSEQLKENLAGAALKLSTDEVRQLDEASQPVWGYPYDFIRRFEPW